MINQLLNIYFISIAIIYILFLKNCQLFGDVHYLEVSVKGGFRFYYILINLYYYNIIIKVNHRTHKIKLEKI